MSTKEVLPFGTWPSTISAQDVANGGPRISETTVQDGVIYWLQGLPGEAGRTTIMRSDGRQTHSILSQPFNVRSKVHEYGGGSYCLTNSTVYFCNADDQQIYATPTTGMATPRQITHTTNLRFADLVWDAQRKRLIAVCESHTPNTTVENSLISIDTEGNIRTLATGNDFYAYPRVSPCGQFVAWIHWNQPDMPWDATVLTVAEFTEAGDCVNARPLNNTCTNPQSIVQPLWSAESDLYFVSDQNNWWNIYRIQYKDIAEQSKLSIDHHTQAITALEVEFATPLWVFRMQNFTFLSAQCLLASYTQNGRWHLCKIDVDSKELSLIGEACSSASYITSDNGIAAVIKSSPTEFAQAYRFENNTFTAIGGTNPTDTTELSTSEPLQFPTTDKQQAHMFFYPPHHPRVHGEGPPPCIVICHGGPTGQTDDGLNHKIQFWTSRGFAVADINYRGSTGFGSDFRRSLNGLWGVADVEDMVSAVHYLTEVNRIDPKKVVIKGSSAGGYTVLAALAFTNCFSAGVSLYGIGDLELLAQDTHKFEARYLDTLVGAYPAEQQRYRDRSPIHSVDTLSCPLLLFQGLEDNVVPPNQAQLMARSVEQKRLPVALVEFPGEGHGFRAAATIEHMLEAELYFYQSIFSLPSTFSTPPITIKNI